MVIASGIYTADAGCLKVILNGGSSVLFNNDCGARVAATLEPGSYIIEAFEGTVYIIKVGEDGRLWGKNEPVF